MKAMPLRLAPRRIVGRAVEQDLALVGRVDAGQHLDEVDLPAPFSPSSARISPRRRSRPTSETARVPPKRLVIPWRDRTGGDASASARATAKSDKDVSSPCAALVTGCALGPMLANRNKSCNTFANRQTIAGGRLGEARGDERAVGGRGRLPRASGEGTAPPRA